MATLTIRNLEDDVRDRLRIKAAQHGRSMEEEVRVLLREGVGAVSEKTNSGKALWDESRRLFGKIGVDLELPNRNDDREMPDFS